MAGGEGTRLSVLADRRAKPAVPFGGIYRIIDFTLSNVMHSGGRCLGVVTQYRPYSLSDHIGVGEWWGLQGFGRKAKCLSPHTGDKNAGFYVNTADAIYHNIEFIERFPAATEVLILSGDHIYKMDYRPMIEQHRRNQAVLTLATQEVPWEETSRFGLMVCDDDNRIIRFQEKPKKDPLSNKASLGIYVFNRAALLEALRIDQLDPASSHDFGKDIIPRMIRTESVYNYDFKGYWRDVGTIKSYMDTSMEALDAETTGLDLQGWGVRTNHREIPLEHQVAARLLPGGSVHHSLLSKGTVIEGDVRDSVISPGVHIGRGAKVHKCILLHHVRVEEDAVLENVIMDKHSVIGKGAHIGDTSLGDEHNRDYPQLLNTGTSVIGKWAYIQPGVTMGCNCLVQPKVWVERSGKPIQSGTTLFKIDRG